MEGSLLVGFVLSGRLLCEYLDVVVVVGSVGVGVKICYCRVHCSWWQAQVLPGVTEPAD